MSTPAKDHPGGRLDVLTATAAWPLPAGQRAELALRVKLREVLLDNLVADGGHLVVVDRVPDWATLTVTDNNVEVDRGRTWFGYTVTVRTVHLRAGHAPRPSGQPTAD